MSLVSMNSWRVQCFVYLSIYFFALTDMMLLSQMKRPWGWGERSGSCKCDCPHAARRRRPSLAVRLWPLAAQVEHMALQSRSKTDFPMFFTAYQAQLQTKMNQLLDVIDSETFQSEQKGLKSFVVLYSRYSILLNNFIGL